MCSLSDMGREVTGLEVLDVKTHNSELANGGTYVLVDGMNVALARNDNKKARLGDIMNILHKLEGSYDNIETYVDASIRHRIDDIKGLDALIRAGKIYLCPAGITADELIWQRALSLSKRGHESTIVTNDMFPVKKYSTEFANIRNLTAAIIKGGDIYLIERNIGLLHSRYCNSVINKRNTGKEIIH